ncbi:MAG: histidine phosphatase family protein [Caldimicrobium sp.]|nr:histidine phosphatase family protein [Caldimicrobium sp.]MCX7613992.1 histidine phosphatase family protein [Caldimicrobium sp.]MDW8182301.1 histidine phosphatase family protein [Caldimicrobium sp.]
MKHLFLIRHGQIEDSFRNIFYGQMDVPLSKEGLKKSEELVDHLVSLPVKRIFSSPLKRALYPAKLIAEKKGLTLDIRDELKEIDYGEWAGKPRDMVYKEPLFWERFKDDALSPPGGESIRNLRDRAKIFWLNILSLKDDGLYIAFTHGGFIRAFLCEILNLQSSLFYAFESYHLKGPLISIFKDGLFVIRGFNFEILSLKSLLETSYW